MPHPEVSSRASRVSTKRNAARAARASLPTPDQHETYAKGAAKALPFSADLGQSGKTLVENHIFCRLKK
jgi:hypothetical protein